PRPCQRTLVNLGRGGPGSGGEKYLLQGGAGMAISRLAIAVVLNRRERGGRLRTIHCSFSSSYFCWKGCAGGGVLAVCLAHSGGSSFGFWVWLSGVCAGWLGLGSG